MRQFQRVWSSGACDWVHYRQVGAGLNAVYLIMYGGRVVRVTRQYGW